METRRSCIRLGIDFYRKTRVAVRRFELGPRRRSVCVALRVSRDRLGAASEKLAPPKSNERVNTMGGNNKR